MKTRGVIWDVDGTLVNSNDAHARAWVSALSDFNLFVSFEAIRMLIGMGGDKLLPAAARIEADSKLGRAISARRAEIFSTEHLPKLRAFPRVRPLWQRLTEGGVRHAVASSAAKAELDVLLRLADVQDLLVDAPASADKGRSKPDPDIVQAALSTLQLEPSEVIMVGDTPFDVEAARRAGIAAIALRSGGRSDHDLHAAIAIYDDPSDLLQRLATSPLAR